MDLSTMTRFFMWCTIINVSLMILWVVLHMLIPDVIFRLQTRMFPMPKETFNVVFYSFLGVYKIGALIFSVVPYAALLIIG